MKTGYGPVPICVTFFSSIFPPLLNILNFLFFVTVVAVTISYSWAWFASVKTNELLVYINSAEKINNLLLSHYRDMYVTNLYSFAMCTMVRFHTLLQMM